MNETKNLPQVGLVRRAQFRDQITLADTTIVDFHRVLTHRFHLNLTHPETA